MPNVTQGLLRRLRLRGLPRGPRNPPKRAGLIRSHLRPRLPPKVYGRIGDLEVRLALTKADVKRAQRLRYDVFYREMSAKPTLTTQVRRRDEDRYDAICDHLLVIDTSASADQKRGWSGAKTPRVIGTYRVLRQEIAQKSLGFYTQSEYDIAPLIATRSPRYRFMELGRSCVLRPYRNKRTVELLWHGLWTYVREHGIEHAGVAVQHQGRGRAREQFAVVRAERENLAREEIAQSPRLVPADLVGGEAVPAVEEACDFHELRG